jgi:hypothetical protein
LVGAVRGREHHEADELAVALASRSERHPVAQAVHLAAQRHPPRMRGDYLVPGPRPAVEVSHHLRIGVELDLQLEVPVRKRDQQQAGSGKNRLRHAATIAQRHRRRDLFSELNGR